MQKHGYSLEDLNGKLPLESLEMPELEDFTFDSNDSDSDQNDVLEEFRRETEKDREFQKFEELKRLEEKERKRKRRKDKKKKKKKKYKSSSSSSTSGSSRSRSREREEQK